MRRGRITRTRAFLPIAALVAVAALAACSGNDSNSKTIQVWTPNTGDVDMAAQQKIARQFEAQNPGVKVNIVPKRGVGAGDATAIINAVRGKTPPDVFMIDRFTTAQQASIGLFTDLQPLIDKDKKAGKGDLEKQYLPFAIRESKFNGHVYSLPVDTDVRGLYYNKDVMRDAGVDLAQLDPKNGPITIDQMWKIALQVNKKDKNGNYTRMGMVPWDDEASPATWGLIRGAKYFDEKKCEFTPGEPAFRQTFDSLWKWAKDLDYQRTQTFKKSFTDTELDPAKNGLYTGRLGMQITGNFGISNIQKYAPKLDYGVTWLPVPKKGDRPVTWSGGFAMAIPTGVKNPELSWKFAKFMAGPVGQKIYASETNRLATWKSLGDDKSITKGQGFFPQMLPYSTNRPALPVGAQIWDAMETAEQGVTLGETTPDEAIEQIYARVGPKMKEFCPYSLD